MDYNTASIVALVIFVGFVAIVGLIALCIDIRNGDAFNRNRNR